MNLISMVAALMTARIAASGNALGRDLGRMVRLPSIDSLRFVQAVASKSKLARKKRVAQFGLRQALKMDKAGRRAAKADAS